MRSAKTFYTIAKLGSSTDWQKNLIKIMSNNICKKLAYSFHQLLLMTL